MTNPDDFYFPGGTYDQTIFCPWENWGCGEFSKVYDTIVRTRTIISPDRLYILYALLKQTMNLFDGYEAWECGVYRGGSARLLSNTIEKLGADCTLRLFDTFEGIPEAQMLENEEHEAGDFNDTNIENIFALFRDNPRVKIHKGIIPATFGGLENSRLCFTHIDLDIYQSVLDCTKFIYRRTVEGGFIVYDDYGFETTKGCKQAVDEFFADKPQVPIVLPTGQAIVCI